jgi:hypothetical protein
MKQQRPEPKTLMSQPPRQSATDQLPDAYPVREAHAVPQPTSQFRAFETYGKIGCGQRLSDAQPGMEAP